MSEFYSEQVFNEDFTEGPVVQTAVPVWVVNELNNLQSAVYSVGQKYATPVQVKRDGSGVQMLFSERVEGKVVRYLVTVEPYTDEEVVV